MRECGRVEFDLLIELDMTNACSYNVSMDSMGALKAAVAAFRGRDHQAFTSAARGEELRELREVIDSLELEFSSSARAFQAQHGHLAEDMI